MTRRSRLHEVAAEFRAIARQRRHRLFGHPAWAVSFRTDWALHCVGCDLIWPARTLDIGARR